jgi:hypothetical protein
MVDSEKVQFCLANVSRNERMALLVRDRSLKASYTDSANRWRRLAERVKQLEKERLAVRSSRNDSRENGMRRFVEGMDRGQCTLFPECPGRLDLRG